MKPGNEKLQLPPWALQGAAAQEFIKANQIYLAQMADKVKAVIPGRRFTPEKDKATTNLWIIQLLSGLEFEIWSACRLSEHNWHAILTIGTSDRGVDIIAAQLRRRIAFSCKHIAKQGLISSTAIRTLKGSALEWSCNEAGIITNSHLTGPALTSTNNSRIPCHVVTKQNLTANWNFPLHRD